MDPRLVLFVFGRHGCAGCAWRIVLTVLAGAAVSWILNLF